MEIKATKKYCLYLNIKIKCLIFFLSIHFPHCIASIVQVVSDRMYFSFSIFFSCRVFIQSSFKLSLNAFASAVCVCVFSYFLFSPSKFEHIQNCHAIFCRPAFSALCPFSLFLFSVICLSTFCRFYVNRVRHNGICHTIVLFVQYSK